MAKSEKSGLEYDDLGFLIGMRRVERSTTQIEKDVSDVLSLLKGGRTPLNVRVVQSPTHSLNRANTSAQAQIEGVSDNLKALTERLGSTVRIVQDFDEVLAQCVQQQRRRSNQANSAVVVSRNGGVVIDSGALLEHQRQQRQQRQHRGNASNSNTSTTTVITSSTQDNASNNASNSPTTQSRMRDANGRFIGAGGASSAEGATEAQAQRTRDARGRFQAGGGSGNGGSDSLPKKIIDGLTRKLGIGNQDTKGIDPTVDAINELGTIFTPVVKTGSLLTKPLAGMMKSRKRNEPIPREQQQANRDILNAINRNRASTSGGILGSTGRRSPLNRLQAGLMGGIGRLLNINARNSLTPSSLVRVLPMVLMRSLPLLAVGLATALGIVLVGALSKFFPQLSEKLTEIKEEVKDTGGKIADFGFDTLDRIGAAFGNQGAKDRLEQRAQGQIGAGSTAANNAVGATNLTKLNGKKMNEAVYDSFKKQGLTDAQAKALTAEVGRENDFNAKTMFGKHTDMAKDSKGRDITNYGMFSWNRDRADKLKKFMADKGLMDKDGNFKKSQESLDAQAEFAVKELKSGTYKDKVGDFWTNPNKDPNSYAKGLGKGYVGWAYGQDTVRDGKGGRKRFDWRSNDQRRANHLKNLEADLKKSTPIVQKANAPTTSLEKKAQPASKSQAFIPYKNLNVVSAQEKLSSSQPKRVVLEGGGMSSDIGQNVSDRSLAHALTGGIGMRPNQ